MSKAGKILFFFSLFAFIILACARLVYGGWHDAFWVPFALWIVLFIAGAIKERRPLGEIFMMRTTKHGMNMGALVLIALTLIACVNFLASRYEKKIDMTSDRLNSLSDQSIKAARALKSETELVLVFRKEALQENIERHLKDLVAMYKNVSDKITFTSYNGLQRPDLAQKFEFTYGPYVFYAVQGERKVKIDPATEEAVTRALLRLGREKKKTIYFVRGHGEHLLDDKDAAGLSVLKEDLAVTYDVKSVALFESGNRIPEDADAVAIVGPKQQFLDGEIKALSDYARKGGHFLIALDPGVKQNLAGFVKSFGIEFANDYVLDLRSRVLKGSPTLVLGTEFSTSHEITRAFKSVGNEISLFELASSLKKAPDASPGLLVDELIKTDANTAGVPELKDRVEFKPNGPHIIAMASKGKFPAEKGGEAEVKEFSAVVLGDSDFLANRLIQNNLNRDLIENAFAWLSADMDLITIRPKEMKGTKLNMLQSGYFALLIALFLMTCSFFASGITFWWRRRTA